MKLLIVEYRDWLNPRAGGAERALREVFRRLAADRGWTIDYLCGAVAGRPAEEMSDGIRLLRRGPEAVFNLAAVGAVRGELRHIPYDLVVEGIDKLPFFLPWLAPRRRVACIIPHLLGETAGEAAGRAVGAVVNAAEALMPRCYRHCTVATGAESTRAELVARGFAPERVHVVPYGLDHTLYRPGQGTAADAAPFLLYVGRLRRYKGLETALRAFAEIAPRHPALRFRIVGQGDDRPRLEGLARDLGLADRVDFPGYVSEAEKVALLQTARVLVYPSRKEGWGLPVLEAGACGVPAVASNVPGLKEAVRDGASGLLVPHGDAQAFAAALERILTDPALATRLGAGAQAFAQEFQWETSARLMGDLLERAAISA